MSIRLALSVTHAPWIGERQRSMARLRENLGGAGEQIAAWKVVASREETDRGPWWFWSEKQWRWGADQNEATHCAFLQDDSVIPPAHVFWPALRGMIAARPDDVIALHCPHPGAMKAARDGARWVSTADGLVGLGYVFPRARLVEMLDWRVKNLCSGGAQMLSEDSHINVWALSTGRKIFHPLPSIVDHDVTLKSTGAMDDHAYRRPRVLWTDGPACGWAEHDLTDPDFWQGPCVHLGRMYAKTSWAAKMVVPGFDRFYEAEIDQTPPEYARFFTYQ